MKKTGISTSQKTFQKRQNQGTLYVVATPIGNLEDMTFRAVRILKEVDIIAAEDTRHTRKLLTHFSISTPTLSYYKEKERERAGLIINKLNEGKNIALVSDAGTPGISDPGSILVQQALAENIRVEPIPGPSSLTAALSVAGIRDSSFVFLGFAPARKKQRQDLLQSLSLEEKSLVFFEAPHRLHSFLQDCFAILGDRRLLWCRELTKMHEEITWDHLKSVLRTIKDKKIKGESVLIIAGAQNDSNKISDGEIEELLKACKKSQKLSLKDAVQKITREHNLSRSAVYRLALKIWK
ncbi:MAG: 16S rRNA (cytidine(1402)-2'-O)-methyltransferase [Deltaproteobacteria bacterium]|jgi:16S rRNA (cytidine1402-2'-O)-methyltransferase|nr:16S rRNA (cytidine(1402)-2'-O)-methyltransferase [Deltaproteobacteria bacterium]